jgi:hypothetical protein
LSTFVALLVASSSISCSLLFVDGPPAQHRSLPFFDCTSSRVAPVVDITLGALYGIAAVDVYASTGGPNDTFEGVAPVALTALALGSALYGFKKVSACREAVDDLTVRLYRERQQRQGSFGSQPPPSADPWLSGGPPPAGSLWPAAAPPDGGALEAVQAAPERSGGASVDAAADGGVSP